MTPADPKRHPCSAAFDDFKERFPRTFDGAADGRYLENRLQEAFQHGWFACERAVKKAMEGR